MTSIDLATRKNVLLLPNISNQINYLAHTHLTFRGLFLLQEDLEMIMGAIQ